ncbi:hypothetical protein E2C01_078264 [Portunus trituberculatus]|uniref:Uncharacterized protein n=1 Tax=Portunus trituberculatus TaxID=210409 RepID=A0A5B7II99_PORTR|nr:hypothetical protein [Portunus trituberculatus]
MASLSLGVVQRAVGGVDCGAHQPVRTSGRRLLARNRARRPWKLCSHYWGRGRLTVTEPIVCLL